MKKKFVFSLLLLAVAVIGGCCFCLGHLGDWLARSDDPSGADVIVCLGGGCGRVELATELLHGGYADYLMVTTAGVKQQVLSRGVDKEKIICPQRFAETTFEEALALNEIVRERGFSKVLIVSDSYHMFRVKWSFAHVCDGLPVSLKYVSGRLATGGRFWWRDRWSRLYVVREVSKLMYYWFGHGLLGIEHDPAWLGGVKDWYSRMLTQVV